MSERTVSIADAKARLSELVSAVENGDDVVITKRGKPVAHLSGITPPRKKIDVEWLRQMKAGMPLQDEDSATLIRQLRDDARY